MRRPLKTLFFRALLVGLLVFGAGSLRADEALRRIQQALRDQGFYYGSIDGSPGDETTQAIRRFQIRNGLAVTGQLNEETRKAIEKPGSVSGSARSKGSNAPTTSEGNATPPPLRAPTPDPKLDEDRRYAQGRPPANPPPPSARQNDDGDDGDAAPARPAPRAPDRPDLRVAPQEPPPGPPSPRYGVPPSQTLTDFFAETPYEFAPPPVQAEVLRRAQVALLRSGFYGGQPDGVPGAMTTQAIAEFQSANRLRRTGRLDVGTLAYLRLLPRANVPSHQYEERRYEGPRPPRVIFEGRIVQ